MLDIDFYGRNSISSVILLLKFIIKYNYYLKNLKKMSKFIKSADIKALMKHVNKLESAPCGNCKNEANAKAKAKIICVGDSITHGSYPALLQELLNAETE